MSQYSRVQSHRQLPCQCKVRDWPVQVSVELTYVTQELRWRITLMQRSKSLSSRDGQSWSRQDGETASVGLKCPITTRQACCMSQIKVQFSPTRLGKRIEWTNWDNVTAQVSRWVSSRTIVAREPMKKAKWKKLGFLTSGTLRNQCLGHSKCRIRATLTLTSSSRRETRVSHTGWDSLLMRRRRDGQTTPSREPSTSTLKWLRTTFSEELRLTTFHKFEAS